jgi:DNA-directed RNA polymerase subunit L
MAYPVLINEDIHNDNLTFTLKNADVSIANALRRTILGNIRAVVMAKSDCNITINTTRFNNEILKQRLACIPVCLTPNEEEIKVFSIELNKSNSTSSMVMVTSEDFKIIENGKASSKKLFLPDPITKQYIDILRLRPKMGSVIESIQLTATLSITTGIQTGTSNMGNCFYKCTINQEQSEQEWSKKGIDDKFAKKDWDLLDAKRYVVPNSFDITVESYVLAIYSPTQLVQIACKVIEKDLLTIKGPLQIQPSDTTMEKCVDIILPDCDYTIGKIIEYYLFTTKFDIDIAYITFLKNHPHDKHGILRIAFKEDQTDESITEMFLEGCKECVKYFNFAKELKSK